MQPHLSQLQNEFLLTQQTIIQQLTSKVKHLTSQLRQSELSHQTCKSKSIKLEYEVEMLKKQLDFEQRECKTRHQNLDKLKAKNNKLKERVAELTEEVRRVSAERDMNLRSEREIEKEMDTLLEGKMKEEIRQKDQEIRREKEANKQQRIELKALKAKLQQAERKRKEDTRQKEEIIGSNQKFINELQISFQKILSKTKELEDENSELNGQFQRVCEQLSHKEEELEKIRYLSTRRYSCMARSRRSDLCD